MATRQAPAPHSRPAWRRWVGGAVGACVVGFALLGGLAQSLRTESGTRWLLRQWPGLTVDQPRGALWGDFEAQRVQWTQGGTRIDIRRLTWQGLSWQVRPAPGAWLGLRLASLQAQQVDLKFGPQQAAGAPSHLHLPLTLELAQLKVGTLTFASTPAAPASAPTAAPTAAPTTLHDLQAQLHLGAQGGQRHQLQGVQFTWGRLQTQGHAQVQTAAPMAVQMELTVQPQPEREPEPQPADSSSAAPPAAWQGRLLVSGPLTEPTAQATIRGDTAASSATRPAHLRVVATLRPWAAWPLTELQGEASDIDLSAFHPQAPRTALRGEALAQTHSANEPAALTLQVRNDDAGPWSQHRLPLRQLSLRLQTRPDQLTIIDLHALKVDWGTLQQAAGQLEGRGHLSHDSWALDLQWNDLQPATLDERGAPMRLSGPVLVSGIGAHWQAQGELEGMLLPPPSSRPNAARGTAPVRLQFKADTEPATPASPTSPARPETWTLHALQAQLGEAKLDASGSATRSHAAAPWEIQVRTQLHHFDPLPWWPGPPGSVWREGGHRLHGEASADIRTVTESGPALPDGGHPWLRGWRGRMQLQLTDSQLAGVPWRAEAELRHMEGPAQIHLLAQAAGNSLRIDGPWPGHPAAAGPTTFDLSAPDLRPLSPWGSLMSPRANMAALSGRVQGRGELTGAGTQLRTQGQLDATDVQWGAQRLQSLNAQWQLGITASSPLQLSLQLQQARWQGRRLASLDLQANGSAEDHTLILQAQLEGHPPAWVDELRQLKPSANPNPNPAPVLGRRTIAHLTAQGGLHNPTPASAGSTELPIGWRGQISQWRVHSEPAAGLPPLWDGQPVSLAWDWGTPSAPAPSLRLSAGQAQWAGSTLRWGPIQWQTTATGEPQLDAELSLDPLPVAPWLARLQPDFGWGGDLRVGLQAKIHSHPEMQAEVVLERQSGDLQVTDETGTQALSLNTLRLALNASDGQWTFTQAIAGQNLGVISGAMVARTGPGVRWPRADTPVQGVLELKVAQMGAWGTWLPTGWRLGGQLRVSAGLAGLWGTPQFTGAIQGTDLSARHVLEGVNITDGKVDVLLNGDTAQINNISARSGKGTLQLQGQAHLGQAPNAQLKMVLDHFQLLGRVDRRLIASGQAQLNLSPNALDLRGQWLIDEGLIDFSRGDAPSLASDVHVVRAPSAANTPTPDPTPLPTPAPPRRIPVHLDLGVDLGRQLRLKGRGLDTALQGTLQVSSAGGTLQVQGTVNTDGGTYKAYGQKLTIDRGVVIFSGDVNNPRLDIEATRPDTDEVRVGVLITGSARNPRVRLFSDPDMADVDKLSWLVLGRASDGLGGTDIALLQRAAVALLSGENEGVTDQLIRAIGLDQLSVRQSDGAVKETIVSVGKQVSKRWFVGYERSLNATEGSWQLIYRLAQRLTLRAQTGHENAADLIWSWRGD